MTLISSNWTLFYKWLLPASALGIAVMMFAAGATVSAKWIFLGVGLVTGAFAIQLANEVYDMGDSLLVKYPGRELRIEIRKIERVELAVMRPAIVTLHVDDGTGKFGKVRFIPRGTGMLHPYGRGPAQDLMARSKEARGSGAV